MKLGSLFSGSALYDRLYADWNTVEIAASTQQAGTDGRRTEQSVERVPRDRQVLEAVLTFGPDTNLPRLLAWHREPLWTA